MQGPYEPRALTGREVMRTLLKLALIAAAALLLHAGIKVAHLGRGAGTLQSGEWTQADAEAIGAVWNLNGSRVDPATQPTTAARARRYTARASRRSNPAACSAR